MAIEIELRGRDGSTRGVTLIDDEDAWVLEGPRLHLDGSGYASNRSHGRGGRVHSLIMPPPPGYEIDHMNGNKLDNRRQNLRAVTHQVNCQNKLAKNVYFDRRRGTWGVQVKTGGKRHLGGTFQSPEAAAVAAAELRAQLFGDPVQGPRAGLRRGD